jgi:glycosyltransferase involved in cell wall biosynthesis
MRVAFVHYWIHTWRGGEKVLQAMGKVFPQADIFTHTYNREMAARELPGHKIFTTFIDRLPFAHRYYERYLPLMPLALEQLDLRDYDLVISNESAPAKGVIVGPHARHLCYCLSPMRYIWDMYPDYRAAAGFFTRTMMLPITHYLRMWDQLTAQRVDQFVAISRFVADRIARYYGRTSSIIYPPVAVTDFAVSRTQEDFYLYVGQLAAYKKPDLMVEAFNALGKPLVVIGEGELLSRLKRIAAPNIKVLGRQPFEVIRDHYQRCKALVFPGAEDFGIVPVEAMACGKPVIAYALGGALDTVVDGVTGILFSKQDVATLIAAVRKLEDDSARFDPDTIRAHSMQFSEENFAQQFGACVADVMKR